MLREHTAIFVICLVMDVGVCLFVCLWVLKDICSRAEFILDDVWTKLTCCIYQLVLYLNTFSLVPQILRSESRLSKPD